MVELGSAGLRASGTQLGVEPLPYRLDYELEVDEEWVTRSLWVQAQGAAWRRELDLRHDEGGDWTAEADEKGSVDLPLAGGPVDAIERAIDCDLALSPLTNVMPVRRHELHLQPESMDFLMAWVSVPDLSLYASRQRYEHVDRGDDRLAVRYVGEHRDFVGELELDQDGFVLLYPDLARRVG